MNFPLQSFSLYTTFKSGIAAAGEPIPSELRFFSEERSVVFACKFALQRQRIEKFAGRKNIFAPQLFATTVFSDT